MKTFLPDDHVEIADGVTLADIKTIADCERAELTLAAQINAIEQQLADPDLPDDAAWESRAVSSINFKKAIRHVVRRRGEDIRKAETRAFAARHDRQLIAAFKAQWPAQFASVAAAATPPPLSTTETDL